MFIIFISSRTLKFLPKYKMREWYDLYCYFLPSAIEVCGQQVDQWSKKVGTYHCLVLAFRSVSGFRPASALDQVLNSLY